MLTNHSILIVFVIAVCVVYYFRHIKEGMKKGKKDSKKDSKKDDGKIKGERTSGKNTSKTEILKNKVYSFIPKWAL
jgi:hypothetical protein